jgi:hypothetical protein
MDKPALGIQKMRKEDIQCLVRPAVMGIEPASCLYLL